MTQSVSTELIVELARYGDLPFDQDRAMALSEILDSALAKLRTIRPDGYEALAPDLNFRVPVSPSDDGRQ